MQTRKQAFENWLYIALWIPCNIYLARFGNDEVQNETYWSSRRMGWTIKSGEYDLMAEAAVGEQMTCDRSAPWVVTCQYTIHIDEKTENVLLTIR